MATEWTSFFSSLIRNYLAAAPVESGIPALTELPKKTQDDTAKLKRPRLIVSCESEPTTHRATFKGTVSIVHGIALTKDGAEPAEAATVNAAIQARLEDEAAWKAYILTLSVADRTGWMITKQRLEAMQQDTDEDKKTRDYTFPLQMWAVTKR